MSTAPWLDRYGRKLTVAVLAAVLLTVWAWWVTRESGSDAMAVAECAGLFARATTAAESARVDLARPIQALSNDMTCGTLRGAGRLP